MRLNFSTWFYSCKLGRLWKVNVCKYYDKFSLTWHPLSECQFGKCNIVSEANERRERSVCLCVSVCTCTHIYIWGAYVPRTLKMWLAPHSVLHHAFPIHLPVPLCTDLMLLSFLAKHLLCTVTVIFFSFYYFLIFFKNFIHVYSEIWSRLSSIFLSISSHIPPHTPSQIHLLFFFDSPVSPDIAAVCAWVWHYPL